MVSVQARNGKNRIYQSRDIGPYRTSTEKSTIRDIFRTKINLCQSDLEIALQYINNPTKSGIWKLRAEWSPDEGISSYLLDDFNKRFTLNKHDIINSEYLTEEDKILFNRIKDDVAKRIRLSLNVIFDIFYRSYLDESKDSKLYLLENVNTGYEQTFFEKFDYGAIRTKYTDAYELFKKEIVSGDFSTSGDRSSPITINGHSVFLEATPNPEGTLTIVSFCREPLESLKDFFKAINKIKTPSIRLWFSPEEDVFSPYIMIVKTVYPEIIKNSQLIKKFEEAIEQYETEEYSHCVNCIGIISEDYLIQIYETLFRDVCPRVPLGSIYVLINHEIEDVNAKKAIKKPNSNEVYSKIKDIEKQLDAIKQNQINKSSIRLIREVFKFTLDQQKYNDYLDKELKSKNTSSLFPLDISDKIGELISYRNATSHKSRTRITEIEAQRMVYCLMSLVTWWNNELEEIDWNNDKRAIIKKCIARNKTNS
jgi:hypothetical protein